VRGGGGDRAIAINSGYAFHVRMVAWPFSENRRGAPQPL
jgi:hypothetical protein